MMTDDGVMMHAGLPLEWALLIGTVILLTGLWVLCSDVPAPARSRWLTLATVPGVGAIMRYLSEHTWPLLCLKVVFVSVFLLIVACGLFGTPIAERNLATVLTWNLWWAGIVFAVFFLGTGWCAVCPWDTVANWLVRHHLWRRETGAGRLRIRVPRALRSVWPASLLFVSLTWLELGLGITVNPYATALLALFMVTMATLSLAVFEGAAFCRYFCPVGRTIGCYSQLAVTELRPIDQKTCDHCETLDCYHGSETIAPCPTNLVMGRLEENTYCIACGNCTQSCPEQNVGWRLRPVSVEAVRNARPHNDEAWFMLILLAFTSFHGFTMLPFWETWLSQLGQWLNDSGSLVRSFSLTLAGFITVPLLLYSIAVRFQKALFPKYAAADASDRKLFSGFAFVALPLAFAYHLAHNLGHLLREVDDLGSVLSNPFGSGTLPLSMLEKHERHMNMLLPDAGLFALQSLLLMAGFVIAMLVVRHRGYRLFGYTGAGLAPMVGYCALITLFNVWMMMQPMAMRM